MSTNDKGASSPEGPLPAGPQASMGLLKKLGVWCLFLAVSSTWPGTSSLHGFHVMFIFCYPTLAVVDFVMARLSPGKERLRLRSLVTVAVFVLVPMILLGVGTLLAPRLIVHGHRLGGWLSQVSLETEVARSSGELPCRPSEFKSEYGKQQRPTLPEGALAEFREKGETHVEAYNTFPASLEALIEGSFQQIVHPGGERPNPLPVHARGDVEQGARALVPDREGTPAPGGGAQRGPAEREAFFHGAPAGAGRGVFNARTTPPAGPPRPRRAGPPANGVDRRHNGEDTSRRRGSRLASRNSCEGTTSSSEIKLLNRSRIRSRSISSYRRPARRASVPSATPWRRSGPRRHSTRRRGCGPTLRRRRSTSFFQHWWGTSSTCFVRPAAAQKHGVSGAATGKVGFETIITLLSDQHPNGHPPPPCSLTIFQSASTSQLEAARGGFRRLPRYLAAGRIRRDGPGPVRPWAGLVGKTDARPGAHRPLQRHADVHRPAISWAWSTISCSAGGHLRSLSGADPGSGTGSWVLISTFALVQFGGGPIPALKERRAVISGDAG